MRDPQWDRWNKEAGDELEKELQARSYACLREAFLEHARSFFSRDGADGARDVNLQLKIDHTFRVCALTEELAAAEPALRDGEISRALALAALFHDLGRFEQFSRYRTFSDAASCNHGVLGARTLRGKKFLASESVEIRRLVTAAVAAHNRPEISDKAGGKLRLVLQALRDADKLDIMRVLTEHLSPDGQADSAVLLHLEDQPRAFTPAVLDALEQGRTALYRDMRYWNDFRILLCSWFFDLHFAASFDIAKREGYLTRLTDGLAHVPEARRKVLAAMERFL